MKIPDPVDVKVGARIRFRRMSQGLSQEALASRLGVTFQQVQKYEKGQNRVGASRLWRISQELTVPVDFFFEDLGGKTGFSAVEDPMQFIATPEGLQLNLAFSQVRDAATRRKIVELVSALSGQSAEATARGA